MTERDPDAGREPEERGGEGEKPARREPSLPADEEAAWAEIVAAYGEEPPDELPKDAAADGGSPARDGGGDGRTGGDGTTAEHAGDAEDGEDAEGGEDRGNGRGGVGTVPGPAGIRSLTVYAAGTGPRDWEPPDSEEDEGHFEPPEPPPLPETDVTTKFAWLAVLGGPLLLIGAILVQAELTWWIVTLGVGGFLGGFATLITRMRDGSEDDDDDPGRGAVV